MRESHLLEGSFQTFLNMSPSPVVPSSHGETSTLAREDCIWLVLEVKFLPSSLQLGLLCQSCPPSTVHTWAFPRCWQETPPPIKQGWGGKEWWS